MRYLAVSLLAFVLIGHSLNAQITFGQAEKINKDWKFCLDSAADYSAVNVNDKKWRTLDVPHDWSVEGKASPSLASCTGYLPGGTGWYRKRVYLPKEQEGKKQFLYFEGVYNNSEVWVNGQSVGYRPNGYISFVYDITPFVKYGKDNVIAVKVDHSKCFDSRWYTGSGIYRNVYLVSSGKVHIDNWGIFVKSKDFTDDGATLDITLSLVNENAQDADLSIEHRVYRKNSSVMAGYAKTGVKVPAGGKSDSHCDIRMDNPELWGIDNPALYRVETAVFDESGNQIDGTTTITGIRETRFDPNCGFFLNGENIKMKGVCLHHDAGSLGSAVPEAVWRRRLTTLKEIGCNAIRLSHNPQAEVLYDLCDELGFLVMDEAFDEWEFPKKKWVEGWNVGNSPAFQGYSEYFNEWAERDLADMVKRDKNHPCVVMWSIGNEVDYPNDPYSHPILDHEGINQKTVPGYKPEKPRAERIGVIAKRLVKVVKSIDTSRAVTGALAGVVMSNHTEYPEAVDLTGYNYTENRYALDHATYPDRIIYGSENTHEYRFWRSVKDNDYIFGQFLWTGIDYLGEAGRWPSRGFICGLMDLGGFMRPRGYYRQSLWSDKPMAFIGTRAVKKVGKNARYFDFEPQWNYNNGELVRVASFTNCSSARLFLNGREITSEPMRDAVSNSLYWDVPFEAGELSIEGIENGEVKAQYSISTYGKAASLVAFTDRQIIGDDGDVAHIVLEIVDNNGVRVRNCSYDVECEVSGAGRLLKLENANPKYMETFENPGLPAWQGRILAYVQSTKKGTVKVKMTVPELGRQTTLSLQAR